jgi:hypothetical protein
MDVQKWAPIASACPDMKSDSCYAILADGIAVGLPVEPQPVVRTAVALPCEKKPPPPPPTTTPPTTPPPLTASPQIRIVPNNPKTYRPERFGEWDDALGCQWYIGGSGCKHVHGLQLPDVSTPWDPVARARAFPRLRLEDEGGRTLCEIDGRSAELKRKGTGHDGHSLWTFKFPLCTKQLVRIHSVATPQAVCSGWFRLLAKSPRARRKATERRQVERAQRKRETEAMDGAHLAGVRPKRPRPPRDGGLTDRESSIQPA